MTLKKCILTANDCYKKGTKMTGGKPTGIVVHSTVKTGAVTGAVDKKYLTKI